MSQLRRSVAGGEAPTGHSRFLPRLRRDDSGATLVEASLALPILLLVLIGILELGLAFKDYLTVSYLSKEGARIGALAGDDAEADCAILRGLGGLATQGDLNRIDSIQIFKADEGTGDQGITNVAQRVDGRDPTVCSVPADPSIDGWVFTAQPWDPTSRQAAVGSQPLDIIGVRIQLNREWVTGFPPFSGSSTVDEVTITRLEPNVFE